VPVTYDARRNKYVARLTHNKVRHYIGAYDSETVATVALNVRKKMLEQLDSTTLDSYKIELEEPDQGLSWGRSIGQWLQRRKARNAK
jgi:hypothetical protein